MARSSEPARLAIIEAAERLFAEQGIEGPTLREVGAAAGQRNNSAVQYHFGDRQGLLSAVLEPHLDELDRRRRVLLDELEAQGTPTFEDLIDLLVLPLAAKLDDPSGVRYLRIQAALLGTGAVAGAGRPVVTQTWRRPVMVEVIERLTGSVERLSRAEGHARQLLVVTLIFNGLANRAAMAEGPPVDLLVRTISDTIRTVLTRPPLAGAGERR